MEHRLENQQCWSRLPPELLHLVFDQLSLAEIEAVTRVCRAWEEAARPVLLRRLQERVKQLEEEVNKKEERGSELRERRREVERLSRLVWQQAERVEAVVKASTRQRTGAWGVMALVMATLLHLALGAILGGVCQQSLMGEL